MIGKKLICMAVTLCTVFTLGCQSGTDTSAVGTGSKTAMRDITTMQLVQDMGLGINLGNTMESCGDWIAQWGDGTPTAYETAWGSPVVTQAMIDGYAEAGFDTLRVPVAWSNLMADDGTYTISDAYMARVKEIVDWALDADLYVILNLHWDGGWLEELPTNHDACLEKYRTIWVQIADAFQTYGDHLIFESQNEELGWSSVWDSWAGDTGKAESYGYVNEVNQTFVDVVRASGGNNSERHLLISGYNTDIEKTCDPLFEMPNDPAGRMAVSVHYYTPASFAILTEDASWGKAMSTWGTESDYAELNRLMDQLKTTFVDQGTPVIIGEYGCPKENKEEESVRRYLSSVCEAALSRGAICPVLWDVTDSHYDRTSFQMVDSVLHESFLALKKQYRAVETASGDVNADGIFSLADLVMTQKFLLCAGNMTDWKAGDVCENGLLNILDLTWMRRLLLYGAI